VILKNMGSLFLEENNEDFLLVIFNIFFISKSLLIKQGSESVL
jgi:hypothetical protein